MVDEKRSVLIFCINYCTIVFLWYNEIKYVGWESARNFGGNMKNVALFCLVAAILLTVLTVFTFAVYGDLNSDSEINGKDAVKLAQYLAKWDIDFTAEDEKNADVFYDGVINAADAVKLAQFLAGWNVELGMNGGDVEVDAGDLFDETTVPDEPPIAPDPLFRVIDGVKYYDVRAAGARGSAYSTDDSAYFIEGVEGYYIDELTFLLDADTMWRIVDVPCTGTGAVKWKGYKNKNASSNPNKFDGILYADKINDPLYAYTCLPSQRATVMNRVNAGNLSGYDEKFVKILPIGAIYNNSDMPIPDDAEFTICLGRTTILLCTEEDGWYIASELATPSKPNNIYYLPWSLEHTLGTMKLDSSRVTLVDDHYEIKMTGAELNGAGGRDQGATGSVLHFWGSNVMLDPKVPILGVVCSFECWIKEEEWAPYVAAAIGADWRDANNTVSQTFSGFNYAVTTEPTVVFGHNVGPETYDEVMDVEKVLKMLEID